MNETIDKNTGLIVSIVKKFKPKSLEEYEALLQAGRIGLWNALKKFDPDKGKLSTYAYNPIYWAIVKELKFRNKSANLAPLEEDVYYINDDDFWEIMPDMTYEEDLIVDLRRQGYTIQQISTTVGRNREYVKKMIVRSIKKANVIYEEKSTSSN